mmetsp:Transcript_11815/g.21534  ORF Transcript_11815/g.21534 Transcript_11815/m.21534 type:complete len:218 (+) Transcript_11815:2-655(+)
MDPPVDRIPLPRFLGRLRREAAPVHTAAPEFEEPNPKLPPQHRSELGPAGSEVPAAHQATPHLNQALAQRHREAITGAAFGLSQGSRGHPTHCQQPCKYVRRMQGCRYGSNCMYCHVCEWRHLGRWQRSAGEDGVLPANPSFRSAPPVTRSANQQDQATSTADLVEAFKISVQQPPWVVPSVGSIGHPANCGPVCRFHFSPAGCDKGFHCLWCHREH